MALIQCEFAVSPPALMCIVVKQQACREAKIDDSLRRMRHHQQALLCLLAFLISLSLHLFQCNMPMPRPSSEDRAMPHTFLFFLHSFFPLLIPWSPMLLFLHSQVASRVRAGFVGAHVHWRDTATDLIVERKRLSARD